MAQRLRHEGTNSVFDDVNRLSVAVFGRERQRPTDSKQKQISHKSNTHIILAVKII